MIPCCPDIYPSSAILWPGENTSFACRVKMRSPGNFVSLEKYLDFKWYRKNGSSYVKISDSETHRYNESCSLLMIKNAKVTPVGGVYYHCEIFYRGTKIQKGKTYDVGLVVHGKLVLFFVGYPVFLSLVSCGFPWENSQSDKLNVKSTCKLLKLILL